MQFLVVNRKPKSFPAAIGGKDADTLGHLLKTYYRGKAGIFGAIKSLIEVVQSINPNLLSNHGIHVAIISFLIARSRDQTFLRIAL